MTSHFAGYLGPYARISQAWLASPFIVLIILIIKLILLKQFIYAALGVALKFTLMECKTMQQTASMALQAPEESIKLANKLISSSISHGAQNIMQSLSFTVTAVESLILFALEMTIGTYACLTLSAVNIGANEALNATEFVVKEANKTAKAIGHDLNIGLGKLTKFVNGAIGLIDSVEEFITGGDAHLKSVNLTIAKLDQLNISSSINTKLESLRTDIPTYDGTKKAVEHVIQEPFEYIKATIRKTNTTFNLNFVPNTTAALGNSSNIPRCNINHVQNIFHDLHRAVYLATVGACVLCGLAILFGIAFNVWKARCEWNRLLLAASNTSITPIPCAENDISKEVKNPFADFTNGNISEQPLRRHNEEALARITTYLESNWLERWIRLRTHPKYWWALRYMFTSSVLAFLLIGIAGVAIGIMETIILNTFGRGVDLLRKFEMETLGDFGDGISEALETWRNQTNAEISVFENRLNIQSLGWVHQGSKGVNQSISTFLTTINGEMDSTFNNTGLLKPLQAVANCLFENKLRKIEQGLRWMYNHSQVALPRVSDNLMASLKSKPSVANAENRATMILQSAMDSLRYQTRIEFIVSSILIAIWFIFAIGVLMISIKSKTWSLYPHSLPGLRQSRSAPVPPAGPISKLSPALPQFGIRRSKRPNPLCNVEVSTPTEAKSPVGKISDRLTQFFSGPAQPVAISTTMSPQRGSILNPETPRTPLRAMIIKG